MRKCYSIVVLVSILLCHFAMAQSPVPSLPEGPPTQRYRAKTPTFGITVAIPFWKIFKKKPNAILDKLHEEVFLNSDEQLPIVAEPVELETDLDADLVSDTIALPVEVHAPMYDLDPVTVTAPRLPPPPPPMPNYSGGGWTMPSVGNQTLEPNGGGGEEMETPQQKKDRECQECKTIMQNKYDSRMNHIRYETVRDFAVVCHLEGGLAFTAVNVVGSWAHFFPGIGTATVELLAVIGGLAVDINCLVNRALNTVKEMNDAKAALYTDMQTCDSKCN